jgi:transposase
MNPRYAVLVGLDWADEKHDVCWLETDTGQIHTRQLEHCGEAIEEWVGELMASHPGGRIAVCLEQSRGAVVYALMRYAAVDLFPVNPLTLAKFRSAFSPSGSKDDPSDARLLLELLERHADRLRVWHPDTAPTRLLRSLCEDRRRVVDRRKDLCNSLRARLKEYYPQALALLSVNLFDELSCAFLMKWPRFEAAAAARPDTLRRFYHAMGSRSETLIARRLAHLARSTVLCTDEAVVEAAIFWVRMLIPQIRTLNRAITQYDKRIAELFAAHPDHQIFASFPGAGRHLAPRLLSSFGTDRTRFVDAREVATYFGTAPVIERSGKRCLVRWRWSCPTFLRQSLVEFAGKSIGFSSWARLYYQRQRQRGKSHHVAVRALANKWIHILFRCWQQGVPYDETTYLAALQRHGSWIAAELPQAA